MSVVLSKQCSLCKEDKDRSEFYKNSRYTSGLSSYCKSCQSGYTVQWGAKNSASRARTNRTQHLKIKYGITSDDYERMLLAQEGVCAICGNDDGERALAVDHCHSTRRVRGLLCLNCNHALGKFKDDISLLRAAITYLEVHS